MLAQDLHFDMWASLHARAYDSWYKCFALDKHAIVFTSFRASSTCLHNNTIDRDNISREHRRFEQQSNRLEWPYQSMPSAYTAFLAWLGLLYFFPLCSSRSPPTRGTQLHKTGRSRSTSGMSIVATAQRFLVCAGGRNVTVGLRSHSGYFRRTSVVALAIFSQYWYWYPLTYFLTLTLQPTALLGLNAELQMPKLQVAQLSLAHALAQPICRA